MSKKPDTPNISAELIDEGSQQLFNESVKECLEVLEGKRGDGLDRALTARDLSDAGVIKVTTSSSDVAGEIAIAPTPEVTEVVEFPTTPTGLTVSGAFTNILLVWDSPTFKGFTSTEVWRYETNLLASSVLVATVEHHMYSEPVSPASTYYYWIRHVNKLSQKGSFNASSGTLGQTNQTVASILTDLNESIGLSSLDTALSADIATIGTIGTSVTAHTSALGAISGEHYVRINGAAGSHQEVAGFGIASGPNSSEFTVNAGIFKVGNGSSSTTPFFIVTGVGMAVGQDGTKYTNQTKAWQESNHPNGKWFAAGTYMETAMIADASIDVAKINNLTVDMAQVTGTLTASKINAGFITADMLDVNAINAAVIAVDNNIEFSGTASGLHFGKTSLGDSQAGAFFGRAGSVTGFSVSSATSGIYADSEGTVALNNVRLYTGAAGSALEHDIVGTYTSNLSPQSASITIIVVGGGAGSQNNAAGGFWTYRQRVGNAGNPSSIQFMTGLNGTGSVISTFTAAGGAAQGYSVSANNDNKTGFHGQASSQAAGGAGGGPGGFASAGTRGSGGGGQGSTYNDLSTGGVQTYANAGTTVSQLVTKPSNAQSVRMTVGAGGTGGYWNYTHPNPDSDNYVVITVAGYSGGNGFVSIADPNSGGIEVDLLSILTRLNAAGL